MDVLNNEPNSGFLYDEVKGSMRVEEQGRPTLATGTVAPKFLLEVTTLLSPVVDPECVWPFHVSTLLRANASYMCC